MTIIEILGCIVIIFGILILVGIINFTKRPILGCPPGFAFIALGGAIAGWIKIPF